MQIDAQKTVQQTHALYQWDDLRNWTQRGTILTRHIYRDENLVIYQQIRSGNRQVVFETPEYTMRVSTGLHKDLMGNERGKKVPYYALGITATVSGRNVYRSLIDEGGYQNIEGDRQYIFDFEKMLPKKYFSLEKDEDAPYVSTYWIRTGCRNIVPHQQFLKKEKS